MSKHIKRYIGWLDKIKALKNIYEVLILNYFKMLY